MSQDRLESIEDELGIPINPDFDGILSLKEFGNLPPEVTDILETNDQDNYYLRYGAIGDGDCLYHAILNLIDDNYLSESGENKKKICSHFKKRLSRNVTMHDYKHLELIEQYPTLQDYKEHLQRKGNWGTDEDIVYISSILNINIFVFQHRRSLPSKKIVKQLVKRGFNKNSAIRAVLATNNKDIEAALIWLTAHEDDDNINEPLDIEPYNISAPHCIKNSVYDETRPTIFLYNFNNMHYESIMRLRKDHILDTDNIPPNLRMFNPMEPFINLLAHQYRVKCLPGEISLRNWRNSDIYLCKTDMYPDAEGWELPTNRGFCPRTNPYSYNIVRSTGNNTIDTCCHIDRDINENGKLTFGHYEVEFARIFNKKNPMTKSMIRDIKKKHKQNIQTLKEHRLDEDMAVYLLKKYDKSVNPVRAILGEIQALRTRDDLTEDDLIIDIKPLDLPKKPKPPKSRTIDKLTLALIELADMGFDDLELNTSLYKKYGDVQKVIEALVQMKQSESEEDDDSDVKESDFEEIDVKGSDVEESDVEEIDVKESDVEESDVEESDFEEIDVNLNLIDPEFDDYAEEDIVGDEIRLIVIQLYIPINNKNTPIAFAKGNPLLSGIYEGMSSLYYQFNNNEDATRVGVLDERIEPNETQFFNDNQSRIIKDYLHR